MTFLFTRRFNWFDTVGIGVAATLFQNNHTLMAVVFAICSVTFSVLGEQTLERDK